MVRHPAGGLIGISGTSPQLSYPLCVFDPWQEFGASWIACNARSYAALRARGVARLLPLGAMSVVDCLDAKLLELSR